MHKDFYASGFLYHPKTQQILLQQQNTADTDAIWSLFAGERQGKETAEEAFRRIIHSHLHLKLKPNNIHLIYSYFHENKNKNNYIYYAKIRKLEKFNGTKKVLFSWFTFKQIQKLHLPAQIRQDIIVGQRVIDAAIRKSLGQQSIE
jgi:ADP-ribose pyrophosphatase YjhB (NUDIX family)